MATQYKLSDLITAIWDSKIEQNAASQIDQTSVANFAVREVLRDLDLRSMKRLASVIDIFDDIYDVTCPPDLKAQKIIDLVPQANSVRPIEIELVTAEEFNRRKSFEKHLVAFNDHDGVRKLRVAIRVGSQKFTASSLDSLSAGGGAWIAEFDASNLTVDNQNFVEGVGSLKFDLNGGIQDGGIINTSLETFDITTYLAQGSIVSWVYLPTAAHLSYIFINVGNADVGFSWSLTAFTTNEGNAFTAGWNLVRFDFSDPSTATGGPIDPTNCNSIDIGVFMDVPQTFTGYRFDAIIFENGKLNQVLYYSKYGWQDASTSAWKENATTGGDYLNVDTEEFNLIVLRGKQESDRRLRDWNALTIDKGMYDEAKTSYLDMYQSEAKSMTSTYYDLESTDHRVPDSDSLTDRNDIPVT